MMMEVPETMHMDLSKEEAIEFKVKEEPWSKYRLEDGTFVFVKYVVTKVYRTKTYDKTGQPVYAWASQNLVTTICPKELRKSPSNPLPTPLESGNYGSAQVDFERKGQELWNMYEFSDGSLLRAKLEITNILRTDKYGADGDPFYIISTQPVTRIRIPPNLVRKSQPKPIAQVSSDQIYS